VISKEFCQERQSSKMYSDENFGNLMKQATNIRNPRQILQIDITLLPMRAAGNCLPAAVGWDTFGTWSNKMGCSRCCWSLGFINSSVGWPLFFRLPLRAFYILGKQTMARERCKDPGTSIHYMHYSSAGDCFESAGRGF